MHLREIMNTRVETISADESAEVARSRMELHGFRHLIAIHNHQIVGIISNSDLGGRHAAVELAGKRVRDLMTSKPILAKPDTTLREAANLLRGYKIGCLPVVEDGKLIGIVTITDLLEIIGRGGVVPARRVAHG